MTNGSTDMENFFNNLTAPSIDTMQRTEPELRLKHAEITNAIMGMQNGKASDADGHPMDFFTKFSHKLSTVLLDMFNYSLSYWSLPHTLTEASITFLLKPIKVNTEYGSYQPISLLNSVKIIAKALALHLETTMHIVISAVQTGFIMGCHAERL